MSPSPQTESAAPTQPEPASTSNFAWALTLFGTAVGAGILFLPIDAGSFGFWPLLIATIFIGPLVFFSHRTYSRIVSTAPEKNLNVLEVITQSTGRKRGLVVAIMYWLSIFPTVLIYGISITNTVDSFLVNQLDGPSIDRWLLASLCIGIMTGAFVFGRKVVLWLSNILIYPLIISLAVVSIYLIQYWDLQSFMSYDSDTSLPFALFLLLPVLVFSFSHMAAISQLVLDMQKSHGTNPDKQVSKVEGLAATMLVGFTMFFVWSCALALGADGMDAAREMNVPVLSYFANVTNTPFMAYIAPGIAICAIATSYFGHMLGTEEGTKYLFRVVAPDTARKLTGTGTSYGIYVFVFVTTTAVAIINPSIINLISIVGGVFVAFLVYLIPLMLFRHVASLRTYAKKPETIIIFIMGLLIMSASLVSNYMA